MRRSVLAGLVLALGLTLAAAASGDVGIGTGGGQPGTSSNFELVGKDPLFARGLNAAIANYDHYVYVGNRTDGSSRCGIGDPRRDTVGLDSCPHPNPGVLVVDVADPANPTVVGEFGQEFVTDANEGQTSRELRVWPAQKLLMVMYFRCSSTIHACPPSADTFRIRFFDLTDPVHPTVVSTYVPSRKPHEMYLWLDPKDSDRALLWLSTPTVSANPSVANLVITDISRARDEVFTEIAKGNWNQFFPGAATPANYDSDLSLHSMTPSFDGRRTYLAYLRGGFGVLDTSEVAADTDNHFVDLNDKLLTPVPFPTWGTGPHCEGHTAAGCAESHSAVPLPGRPFTVTIDEVYGTFPFQGQNAFPSFGWPWGWARLWNVAQPRRPHIVGEYKILQNTTAYTPAPGENEFNSYSSHNPTATRNVILDSWHSGGEQAIDVSDPGQPVQAGWFSPTTLPAVANEDPALSRGPNKVVIWSFPIVRNGLIYVVDIRNGLYVLRYTGPHADEVTSLSFLEGNSNLGDAGRIDKSSG
jgi:hypothetical protein